MGGGDQERTKEVELTLAATSSSGGALGAEKRSHYHALTLGRPDSTYTYDTLPWIDPTLTHSTTPVSYTHLTLPTNREV